MSGHGGPATLAVSLEDHLAHALRPLLPLLPQPLAAELDSALHPPPSSLPSTHSAASSAQSAAPEATPTVPYDLLAAISKWSRTAAGEQALVSREPPLQRRNYAMVALLAGTRTSPDRKFPSVPVPGTALQTQAASRRELSDRRAVTAVLNALLTIGGSAAAAFYASGRLAWRDEWRVLLALSVAILVASSEAVLYLIWSSRRSERMRTPTAALRFPARDKKKEAASSPDSADDAHDAAAVGLASSIRTAGTAGTSDLRERVLAERTRSVGTA
ncbi:hypothetical protein C2E23DRAFT_827360 [Lenzites betulinus]|nr:hypothetical protein C2E23DRAFT_827360 [Lenzites betulinus]